MKRKENTERGEGKWERISWDQAMLEIADKFLDYTVEHGPESVTCGLGTQMVMKRASYAEHTQICKCEQGCRCLKHLQVWAIFFQVLKLPMVM